MDSVVLATTTVGANCVIIAARWSRFYKIIDAQSRLVLPHSVYVGFAHHFFGVDILCSVKRAGIVAICFAYFARILDHERRGTW